MDFLLAEVLCSMDINDTSSVSVKTLGMHLIQELRLSREEHKTSMNSLKEEIIKLRKELHDVENLVKGEDVQAKHIKLEPDCHYVHDHKTPSSSTLLNNFPTSTPTPFINNNLNRHTSNTKDIDVDLTKVSSSCSVNKKLTGEKSVDKNLKSVYSKEYSKNLGTQGFAHGSASKRDSEKRQFPTERFYDDALKTHKRKKSIEKCIDDASTNPITFPQKNVSSFQSLQDWKANQPHASGKGFKVNEFFTPINHVAGKQQYTSNVYTEPSMQYKSANTTSDRAQGGAKVNKTLPSSHTADAFMSKSTPISYTTTSSVFKTKHSTHKLNSKLLKNAPAPAKISTFPTERKGEKVSVKKNKPKKFLCKLCKKGYAYRNPVIKHLILFHNLSKKNDVNYNQFIDH